MADTAQVLQWDITQLQNDPNRAAYYANITWWIKSSNAAKYANYLKTLKTQQMSENMDNLTYGNDIDQINNYIKYAKNDYILGLAKNDSNLADALQQATESYGKNLLGSGIQVQWTTDLIDKNNEANKGILNTEQDQLSQYSIQKNRAIEKYQQYTKPMNDIQDSNIKYSPSAIPNQNAVAETYLHSNLGK